ncbi:unnamed protein product [Blepharisma stoltei]|uniref:Uncharacterized protein n=1 Tax=Blepharisma stoltei TaxID=1481888 RepID=A0AAU9JE48_9CILI|nr:unnamed protein product [Blepharisma stoltei]
MEMRKISMVGKFKKKKELIMELFNIAGSLLNDDEYYNSKCLFKHCRKILEKIKHHTQIDYFFIDYYLYMIHNTKLIQIAEKMSLPQGQKTLKVLILLIFLDFIASTYVNWGESHKPKEFLKKTTQISKMAFRSEDHYDGWLCFCKGLINFYVNNFDKADIYFRTSKIYFQSSWPIFISCAYVLLFRIFV